MGSGASRRDAFYINKLVEMRDSLISDMDDEMLQMFGIEEIMNLTEKKPLYMEAFCKEEVTARIVESMTRWKANELVIRAATKMFTFSLLEDDCAEQLRKLNGKKLLEELLVIHKYDNFVTEDGGVCLELLFETCNKVGQQKIEAAYKNKDPLEICAVMREHPYKPKVQELGVTCLAYLTEASTELIEKMKEDETTIPTVCFAMEEYYTNHRTVMFGLNVMCNWAEEPEGRSLVGKLGGIPRVMEALVEFSGWGEREHEKQQEAETGLSEDLVKQAADAIRADTRGHSLSYKPDRVLKRQGGVAVAQQHQQDFVFKTSKELEEAEKGKEKEVPSKRTKKGSDEVCFGEDRDEPVQSSSSVPSPAPAPAPAPVKHDGSTVFDFSTSKRSGQRQRTSDEGRRLPRMFFNEKKLTPLFTNFTGAVEAIAECTRICFQTDAEVQFEAEVHRRQVVLVPEPLARLDSTQSVYVCLQPGDTARVQFF